MKLAFLVSSLSRSAGGVFDAARRLAQSLYAPGQRDIEVLGLEDEHTLHDAAAWHPLHPRAFPVRGPRAFGYAPRLSAALDQLDVTLVHSHGLWMYPSAACRTWARHARQPHVVTTHGMLDPWAVRRSRWKKRLAGWLYENENLRRAACIHALNDAEADAVRTYGLRHPVCVIPNGIDLPADTAPPPPTWADRIEPGRKVLLFLGRLHPKKGLLPLLRAWVLAGKHQAPGFDDWSLVIAGWSQNRHAAELARFITHADLERTVHLVGPQFGDERHATYARADGFVLPSLSEGLPMTVLEAWAHRLPVLMTPECNLPDGFAAGAALRLAPEPETMARQLGELFCMTAPQRAAIGTRGRRLVAKRYAWDQIAGQMSQVYDWLLGGGARPTCVPAS